MLTVIHALYEKLHCAAETQTTETYFVKHCIWISCRKTPGQTSDSLVMDIKRPVMHIRQTFDKRTTGSTRASRIGGFMSTADTEVGWPLHPHTSQLLALQVVLPAACVQ